MELLITFVIILLLLFYFTGMKALVLAAIVGLIVKNNTDISGGLDSDSEILKPDENYLIVNIGPNKKYNKENLVSIANIKSDTDIKSNIVYKESNIKSTQFTTTMHNWLKSKNKPNNNMKAIVLCDDNNVVYNYLASNTEYIPLFDYMADDGVLTIVDTSGNTRDLLNQYKNKYNIKESVLDAYLNIISINKNI